MLGKWIALTGLSVVGLVGWVAKGINAWRSGGDGAATVSLDQAGADLAARVRHTWSREAAHRGLTTPQAIPLLLRPADPRIAAHPAQWTVPSGAADAADPDRHPGLTGQVTEVAELYRRVSTGRLVIVGPPGGGKTAAALLLLLAIADVPRADGRVPVWFSLASWDPSVGTIDRWMAEQLVITYGTPAATARALIDNDCLLPVLDGLDEIAAASLPAAIAGLHALGATPLVLTCRTSQYTRAVSDGVLSGAAVVTVEPVDAATAADYLVRSGTADVSRWQPILRALRDPVPNPCQQALCNPLLLSLARTVYQAPAADPAELTRYPSAEQVEDRLLDGLVPAVFGRTPADITAADARRWLSFFADHLHLLGPASIGWWRLPRCVDPWRLRVAAGLAYGLAASVWTTIVVLVFVAYLSPTASLVVGLAVGLAVAAAGALIGPPDLPPAQYRRPGWRDVTRGFATAVPLAMMFGIVAGLVVWLATGFADALGDSALVPALADATDIGAGVCVAVAVIATVLFGLVRSFSRQQRDAITPLSAFGTDVRAGGVIGLIVGGIAVLLLAVLALVPPHAGFAVVSMMWYRYDESPSLSSFAVAMPIPLLSLWLMAVLGIVLWFGLRRSTSWWYLIAVAILARRGVVPRRPLRFLEDAYRRGVLRQAAMLYEFRHARLAQRLRTTDPDRHEPAALARCGDAVQATGQS
ncbi:hypothetical protein ACFFX1_14495 [Dactylosporangium sucinum]|uniref:NACHT domain-containing protein n=1 Tax=Dactylosporangium sucinum TaxID=1424081 RepID=A0A917UCM3_9ACTN|nr:hypothetical protein [Dactylosporangium sucinum]GGM69737.1 NACHT domain-containing protein [Dactylosporangium sucinum]